jgi:hypothetical protein
MSELKIYRIRNRQTQMWSSGGGSPRWGKRGKTWDTLGHVQSHITNSIRYSKHFYDEADIVEIVVQENEGNTFNISEFIDRKDRQRTLTKKYGSYLGDMVAQLEKQDLVEQYRWCLIARRVDSADDFAEWFKTFARLGIRKANYRYKNNVVAFDSKDSAMKARLGTTMGLESLDLVSLVENY